MARSKIGFIVHPEEWRMGRDVLPKEEVANVLMDILDACLLNKDPSEAIGRLIKDNLFARMLWERNAKDFASYMTRKDGNTKRQRAHRESERVNDKERKRKPVKGAERAADAKNEAEAGTTDAPPTTDAHDSPDSATDTAESGTTTTQTTTPPVETTEPAATPAPTVPPPSVPQSDGTPPKIYDPEKGGVQLETLRIICHNQSIPEEYAKIFHDEMTTQGWSVKSTLANGKITAAPVTPMNVGMIMGTWYRRYKRGNGGAANVTAADDVSLRGTRKHSRFSSASNKQ